MTFSNAKGFLDRRPTFIRWIKNRLTSKKSADKKVSETPRHDVFISYARKNTDFVFRLEKAFDQINKNYWIDRKDIRHTEEWLDAIYSGIEAADNFIFILTSFSVISENCAKELGHAIKHRKRLIPILQEDLDAASVPLKLAELDWISFSESDDFDACFGKLIDAINTDLEHVRMHTRVLTRAIEWHAGFRPRSLLLRGGTLRSAEKWLSQSREKQQPEPTPLQVEYIRASRKATWIRLTLVCTTALALVGIFLFAQEQSNQAKSRRLAIESSNALSTDPELSLLLAAEAWRASQTQEAENAVSQALNESRLRVTIRGYDEGVKEVTFSPDGQYVLTMKGNEALLSEAATGKKVREYFGYSATFSRDGQSILTFGGDNTARVYDTATGTLVSVLNENGPYKVYRGDLSPDGRFVITSGDETAIVWDARTEKPLHILKSFEADGAGVSVNSNTDSFTIGCRDTSIAKFSPDGGLAVVVCSGDKKARVWETLTWQPVADLVGLDVNTIAFSKNGRRLVIGHSMGGDDTIASVWEAHTGKRVSELRSKETWLAETAIFSPDGEFVLTSEFEGIARLWNAQSGTLVRKFRGHADVLNSAAFSADGRFVVTSSRDKTARVWEASTGSLVTVLSGHTDWVNSAVFSPDSTYIATASNVKRRVCGTRIFAERSSSPKNLTNLCSAET